MKISNQQLINFLESRYYFQDAPGFIKNILTSYPEFQYAGPAYRAVILGEEDEFDSDPGRFVHASFAKNLAGITHFINNFKMEGPFEVKETILIKGNILGLDLSLLIKHLEKNGYRLSKVIKQIQLEQEIIAHKVHSIEVLSSGTKLNF